jgi:hypothetical protein
MFHKQRPDQRRDERPDRRPHHGLLPRASRGALQHAAAGIVRRATTPAWTKLSRILVLSCLLLWPVGNLTQQTSSAFSATSANSGNTYSASACMAGTITVTPASDSYVTEANPGTTHGTDTTLRSQTQNNANQRTFVLFDLPTVPSVCVVTTAVLTLTLASASLNGSPVIQAYQAAGAWSEGGLKWPNQPATTGTPATGSGTTGLTFPVTSQVAAMYAGTNAGFVILTCPLEIGPAGMRVRLP